MMTDSVIWVNEGKVKRMSELTICMTPEQIKDLLGLCSENICPDECPLRDGALYCENALMKEALVYIMLLEEQLDKARLVQDCSNCGEDYCDTHFYPCCACEPAPPTRMSKWHPEGTEAEPRKEKCSEAEPGSISMKDFYSKSLLDMYSRGEEK